MASKSYDWDVRNMAKINPKMVKKQPFFDFFRFSQTVHTIRTKASQKEKDLSRLLYRICGSGYIKGSALKFKGSFKRFQKAFRQIL